MAKEKKRGIYLNNPNLPTVDAQFEYTPEMVQEIKKCEENVLYFAENYFYIISIDEGKQKIKLHTYQRRALRMMRDNRFSLLLFSRQTGKALALDTPVPTPGGWTTMGELKAGDRVYDENGKECNIVYAHEVLHDRACYNISFSNGDSVVADSDHQWVTSTSCGDDSVKTTKEIAETVHLLHSLPGDTMCHVVDVSIVESVPVRCITVDSASKLFQVGKTRVATHNSTISTIFCLWTACFNNDQNILLVANKESTAKEIFKRIRLAFEELPNWMKPGVKEYGKESMELANGSRIGITTTTGTAGRGSSANLLFIDEADWIECVAAATKITLRRKNTNTTYQMTIENAQAQVVHSEFEILTDAGWKTYKSIHRYDDREACTLVFDDKSTLTCSIDHELLTASNVFIKAIDARGKKIASKHNSSKKVVSVTRLKDKISLFDVIDVDGSKYLTNDVVSHNCNLLDDFWASVYPIISSSKKSKIIMASTPRDTSGLFYRLYDGSTKELNNWAHMKIIWSEVPGRDEKWARDTMSSLSDPTVFHREFECRFDEVGESAAPQAIFDRLKRRCSDPQYVYMDGTYRVWHLPQPDHIYVVGVDVAEGVGKDFTVAHVLDVTDLRQINQVAMYASNTVTPSEFTPKLHEILKQWGNPLLLSERNNCGAQVVDNLRKDFLYENIVSYGARELGRSKIPLGIISHSNTKPVHFACSRTPLRHSAYSFLVLSHSPAS